MGEIHLELPEALAGALAGLANDRGMTLECLIEEVLRNYVEQGVRWIAPDMGYSSIPFPIEPASPPGD